MPKIRLDNRGIGELLKSPRVAGVVADYASSVRDHAASDAAVQRHSMDVQTASGVTDRARSIVTIMHPGGLGVQAKHGSLSRAVAAAGLSTAKVR